MSTKRKPNSTKPKGLAIYHVMRADEDFDDTADILFQLVKSAAASHPGQPRHLYFDVEGHRNTKGGYDGEAMDVYEFIVKYLAEWLAEFPGPLARYRNDDQREDVPERLVTQLLDSDAEVDEMIAEARAADALPCIDAADPHVERRQQVNRCPYRLVHHEIHRDSRRYRHHRDTGSPAPGAP